VLCLFYRTAFYFFCFEIHFLDEIYKDTEICLLTENYTQTDFYVVTEFSSLSVAKASVIRLLVPMTRGKLVVQPALRCLRAVTVLVVQRVLCLP